MERKFYFRMVGLMFIPLLLGACLPGLVAAPPSSAPGGVETAAAQTVSAYQTQGAFNTLVSQLTQVSQSTATPIAATETPMSPTATATSTIAPPTATPVPPTPTNTPIPCNWAKFVADVTIPDNSLIGADVSFTKTWRLQNVGSCTWNSDYALVFVSGNSLGGPAAIKIGKSVSSGENVDVSVKLFSPEDAGVYTGYWMLRNDYGVAFGIGGNASSPFWVKIKVEEDLDIPDDNPRNFAYSYKEADWRSTTGDVTPGSIEDFKNGSVWRTTSPKFEGGYQDDEATLVMIPSDGNGGMITGHYPAVKIKDGDRFRAIIGCLYDSEDCNVTFQINYNIKGNNVIYNLGSWEEKYDDKYREISVDLNSLAGKEVEFYLIIQNNGDSEDDRAFWLMPGIK